APHREREIVHVADVADLQLAVSDEAFDVGVVVPLGRTGKRLAALGNAPPRTRAQPPAVRTIEAEIREEPVPAARALAGAPVRLVYEARARQPPVPVEKPPLRLPRSEQLRLVAVLAERARAVAVVGLPPR